MAKTPNPAQNSQEEAPEKTEQNSTIANRDPVQIKGLEDDVTVAVTEINQPVAAALAMQHQIGSGLAPQRGAPDAIQPWPKELQTEAEDEDRKRDFVAEVFAARETPAAKVYTPPPVPDAVKTQTQLEMEAGRQRVAEFEAIEASRPKRRPQTNETMQSVFRPADYVPDQKKGQGLIPTVTARSQPV